MPSEPIDAEDIILDEIGPYDSPDYDSMNFACPECGAAICEWTTCHNCGWYDSSQWERTMEHYSECNNCGQTIPGDENYLCNNCDAAFLADSVRSGDPSVTMRATSHRRHVIKAEYKLPDDPAPESVAVAAREAATELEHGVCVSIVSSHDWGADDMISATNDLDALTTWNADACNRPLEAGLTDAVAYLLRRTLFDQYGLN